MIFNKIIFIRNQHIQTLSQKISKTYYDNIFYRMIFMHNQDFFEKFYTQ